MKTGRCLYCKNTTELTAEHIMPANMGGNLKAHLVCEPCRRLTNNMDQVLAEHSWVSILRAALTPPERKVTTGSPSYCWDEESGVHLEAPFSNGLRPLTLPQIHILPKAERFSLLVKASDASGLKQLMAFLRRHVENGTLRKMYVKEGPPEFCESPRLVMHRRNDGYVRVPQRGDEQLLFRVLTDHLDTILSWPTTKGWSEVATEQPKLQGTLRMPMREVSRAVTKIAFSTLAHHLGEVWYSRPEFDPVRRYVRDNQWDSAQEPVPGCVPEISPFVNWLPSCSFVTPSPQLQHTVAVIASPQGRFRGIFGNVILYQAANFLVRLSPSVPGLETLFIVHDFSHDGTANTFLELLDALPRLARRTTNA